MESKIQELLAKMSQAELQELRRALESVPEIDILIAVAVWLHSHGWSLQSVSIPKGKGMSKFDQKQKLIAKFAEMGIPFQNEMLEDSGPDIIASRDSSLWKIECKGLGVGKRPTLKNNFDRAVASTVSYYDRKGLRLGLSMPVDPAYEKFIRTRIPQELREAINLYLFLYNPVSNSVQEIEPTGVV